MKSVWNYIKHRWIVLLLIFCVASTSLISAVYAKYVAVKTAIPAVTVIAQGVINADVDPVGGGVGGVGGGSGGSYNVSNSSSTNIVTYIRATVVVNWQDGDGNIWAIPPVEDTDYTISAPNCTLLKYGDYEYYYYNGTRKPGEGFGINVTQKTDPDGLSLHVQIFAESIQCVPSDLTTETWGATYDSENEEWTKV